MVRAELPGLKPEEVKLEITDDAIVLEGERKDEREENKGGLHVTERTVRHGFIARFRSPEGAKTDEANAPSSRTACWKSRFRPKSRKANGAKFRSRVVRRAQPGLRGKSRPARPYPRGLRKSCLADCAVASKGETR